MLVHRDLTLRSDSTMNRNCIKNKKFDHKTIHRGAANAMNKSRKKLTKICCSHIPDRPYHC